ncbi:cytochrome B, partial [Halobacteriales archaeon QS_1_69_70]
MSDKYPSDSGRRRFVKGVVGSAALSGVGVGG